MHLLLVRHGETQWNVERRIQGWGNSSLTPHGVRQVELLGKRLVEIPLAAIYCSDAERARQTALAAAGSRRVPVQELPALRETSWGLWEGKTAAEISAEEPELWDRFVNREHPEPDADQADWEATTLVPEGETISHASSRITAGIKSIIDRHIDSGDWILVVGHGGSLRFVIASLLKMRPSSARLFHLDNAGLTHFTIDRSRTVLKVLNDSSHWSGNLVT